MRLLTLNIGHEKQNRSFFIILVKLRVNLQPQAQSFFIFFISHVLMF